MKVKFDKILNTLREDDLEGVIREVKGYGDNSNFLALVNKTLVFPESYAARINITGANSLSSHTGDIPYDTLVGTFGVGHSITSSSGGTGVISFTDFDEV